MTITPLSEVTLLNAAKSLPAAPQIMARLHTLLLDSNSGLVEIAKLLKRDVALTTRIIAIANSPAYKGNGLGSIDEALQRVGFLEVFRLVGVAANASLADADLRAYGYAGETFRANNLLTALLAEGIAKHAGLDARLAYTSGLLRRIGRLLLDRIGRDFVNSGGSFPAMGGHLSDWEQQTFGITSPDVASLLLTHWGFPPIMVQAVGHDRSLGKPPTPLASALYLADCMVRGAGCELEGEAPCAVVPVAALEAVGIRQEDVDEIRARALNAFQILQGA